jgi:hypothetical protein
MSQFHFNENGVCTNPEVLRELHIKGVVHIVLKGAEHDGLWDVSYAVETTKGGSSGPVRLRLCDRTQSVALAEAVEDTLEILQDMTKHHAKIPEYVFATVRSWKHGEQMNLF